MNRKYFAFIIVTVMSLILVNAVNADRGKPDFSPGIYADGEMWGTKATTTIPAPNGHNNQSFDKLFVIVNGADGQLPVGEAAPRNRYYNGGRWFTYTVMWTEAGLEAHDPLPILRSYDDIMLHETLGHLMVAPGSPDGGPPPYFQCPLLPVK